MVLSTSCPLISLIFSRGLIAKFPDVVSLEDEGVDYEAVWRKMAPVLNEALEQVDISRNREGEALKKDVAARCTAIEKAVSAIEAKSPEMLKKYQEELRAKVEAYTDSMEVDEKRVLTEVAIMADKLDISEELTRLKSHTAGNRYYCPLWRRRIFRLDQGSANSGGRKAKG